MKKAKAIEMLGGTVRSAADAIGISYQAVKDWPDVLTPRIADRVEAAFARKSIAVSVIGKTLQTEQVQAQQAIKTDSPAPLRPDVIRLALRGPVAQPTPQEA